MGGRRIWNRRSRWAGVRPLPRGSAGSARGALDCTPAGEDLVFLHNELRSRGAITGRATDGVCRHRRRRQEPIVDSAAGRGGGAAAARYRGRAVSVLVSRQPLGGFFCRWQTQENQRGWRSAGYLGGRTALVRRLVERRW